MNKMTPKHFVLSLTTGFSLALFASPWTFADVGAPQAAPSYNSVGAFAGFGFVGNNNGTKLNIGLDAAHRMTEDFGVGAYFSYISLGSATDPFGNTTSSNLVLLAAEANYYFHGPADGLHLGIKLGPQFTSYSYNNNSSNHTDLGYGAHLAYDYNINGNFTFGPEISVLTSTQNNAPTVTSIIGVLKYFL
jgi:hypothetical protein